VFSSSNSKSKKTRVVTDDANETKPYCLQCCKYLRNDSMRNKKLEDHLKNVRSEHAEKPLEYFQGLR